MVKFRKTREGEWAVVGPASEVVVGRVQATRASGEVRNVEVVGTSRPFDVDGVPHVYGYLASKGSAPKAKSQPKAEAYTPSHNECRAEAEGQAW